MAIEEKSETQYSKIGIDDFTLGKNITFPIFIRLAHEKYIKIAHHGENLSQEKVRDYKAKGIRFLYVQREDFKKYADFNLVLTKLATKSNKISPGKKLNLAKHTSELILERIYSDEIGKEEFESAAAVTESTLEIIMENESLFNLLDLLNQCSDQFYAHSLGVSLYSCLIAKQLRWNSPKTLTKISIIGMFHDLGFKEIDPKVFRKNRMDLNADEVKLMETHVERGVSLLAKTGCFPDDLLQVIKQHHENCIGTGYPARLVKARIHPLARLIAVAEEFCDFVLGYGGQVKVSPREAVKKLFLLQSDVLDSTFLNALAEAVGLVPQDLATPKNRKALAHAPV